MNLTLSWDLFVIVFVALVITYTFIIGKKESMKIMLSSYVAVVAVAGIGNIAERLFGGPEALLGIFGMEVATPITSILKLALFIIIIVFLAVRAGLHIQYSSEPNIATNVAITVLCGAATAGLLLATLITYMAGNPLLDSALTASPALTAVIQQSALMRLLISNVDVLFTLPAVVLIAAGVLNNR